MQLRKWAAESLIEPPFDHLVKHLEIARVKNNAGVIDMPKAHGNTGREYHVTFPKKVDSSSHFLTRNGHNI
jgi:hypothetical protein